MAIFLHGENIKKAQYDKVILCSFYDELENKFSLHTE